MLNISKILKINVYGFYIIFITFFFFYIEFTINFHNKKFFDIKFSIQNIPRSFTKNVQQKLCPINI